MKDELNVTIDYPDGKQKSRSTQDGDLHPLGLFVNQLVTITLNFGTKYAGDIAEVASFDGGEVKPQEQMTVSTNGKVSFTFRASGPGLYRLLVTCGYQFQVNLHVVDPARILPAAAH